MLIGALALTAEAVACSLFYTSRFDDCRVAIGLQIAGALVGGYAVARSIFELGQPRHLRARRRTWALVLVLSVLALLSCAAPIVALAYLSYSFSRMKGFSLPFM